MTAPAVSDPAAPAVSDPAAAETLALPRAGVEAVPRDHRHAIRRLAGLAVFAGVLVALFLVRPVALGGPFTYVIVAGESMEPTLAHGDMVIVRQQRSYGRGDVVAYRVPKGDVGEGRLVIHRIVGGDGSSGYELRGDNRDRPDHWRPRPDDVQGKVAVHLAGTGHLLARIRTPLGIGLVCAAIAFVVIAVPGGQRGEARVSD